MNITKICLVLTFSYCICSVSGLKIQQRCTTDQTDYSDCIRAIIQDFFKNYNTANPDNDIESLDPVTIPSITYPQEDIGISAEFKNVKATGFKDVVISNIETDINNKHSKLSMKFDLIAEGDIAINIYKSGKTYQGSFKYEGSIDGLAEYSYGFETENNMEYYEIGPETVTCLADNAKGALNPELHESINKDPEGKTVTEKFRKVATEHFERILCNIATTVIKTAVENMRAVGRKGIVAP